MEPASKFLCFFNLGSGVKLVLWLHLAVCIYTCGMAIGNVMNNSSVGVATSSGMQIFSAAWSMAGIPIVLMALWGTINRVEVAVRYYLYYLVVSAVIDTVYLIDLFVLRDACVHIQLAVMARGGRAFACGMARMFSGTAAVFATIGVFYMVYIIWSFCEELASPGSAGAIGELLSRADKREDFHLIAAKHQMGRGGRIDMPSDYHGTGPEFGYNAVEAYSGRPHVLGYSQPAYA
uniref:Uncharacterized protein n=1 Tax=Alexandrium catenella TaxID=2925 RepID=A0A7S1L538_ALECA|mmetsp:Transcript_106732/g.283942  ORF Transcript_106732/g.283942 Transcript_106732/m.283942 type:complete len:234 (+) Transcript_106732:131-832(+)